MPETQIRAAVDAERLAEDLIRQYHPHLAEARILWLLTSAKRKRADKTVLATTSRMSVIQRFLSGGMEAVEDGYDFLILISASQWRSITSAQQLALVDHQLCRCGQREVVNRRTGAITRTWCTLSPDVEEFSAVIRRHGLWLTAQKVFAEAIPRQLALEHQVDEPAAAEAATNGVDHAADWQAQTGIGSTEHEQRRRRRAS